MNGPSPPRTLGLSWPLIVGLLAGLLPLVTNGALSDPDTYWHLVTGRWILEHGQIPTHDTFSYSMPGGPWSAHEWGAELVMSLVYRVGGWPGLILMTGLLFGTTLAYVTRFLLRRLEPLYALALVCLACAMMIPSLLARPHVLVWPLTALWAGTLIECGESRRAPPWWLLGVLVLWTNLHGSFVMALALAVAFAADAVFIVAGPRWQTARSWLLFLLAAAACTLINPHGYGAVTFAFDLMSMKVLPLIVEWRSTNLQGVHMLAVWILVIIGLAFVGRIRLSWVRALLVVGLLISALQHQRNVALLALLSPLILARPWATQRHAEPAPGREAELLDRWFRALAAPAGQATIGVSWVLAAAVAWGLLSSRAVEPPANTTPRLAVDALLGTGRAGRVLNDYGFGGYLIFRGIPVFIDGRADLYGDSFIDDLVKSLWLQDESHDLQVLLTRYRVDSTLLSPATPAVRLLDRLPGWQRVYADQTAVVHIRRDAVASRVWKRE